MNRVPVTSSNVASVGYDAASQTLEVEFLDGALYQYFDVPSGVHDGLLGAASVGGYLNQNVKNTFRYAKL